MKIGSVFNLRSKYNSLALIILAVIVFSTLIALLLIRPAWGHLKTLGTEIPTEQAKRDQAKLNYGNLQQAKKFFTENAGDVEAVNTAVPVEPNIPSILVMLSDLAKQNNVTLTSFTPQQLVQAKETTGASTGAANPGGLSSIEVTANYSGQYASLINFFYSLERSLRIVDVKTLNVTSTPNGIEGSISFKAYFRPLSSGGNGTTSTPTPSAENSGEQKVK